MNFRIIQGDFLKVEIPGTFDCVVTSPPYAEQRKKNYNSIPEKEYPEWTVRWMERVREVLNPNGSVFIVIRPHIKNGEISDYVLRTRLAVREAGWIEAEELIWNKINGPPFGSANRPRRNWESILWFSNSRKPKVSMDSGGRVDCGHTKKGRGDYVNSVQKVRLATGKARTSDVLGCSVGKTRKVGTGEHPAAYPWPLALRLIELVGASSVLDPFSGSGSTGVAALKFGASYVGVEKNKEFAAASIERLKAREKELDEVGKNIPGRNG